MRSKILWKIYLIWFFRRIVPLMTLQAIIIGFALKLFANKVFVSQVFANAGVAANSGYGKFFKYLVVAFFQTRPIVQISVLIILGLGALILRDIGRSIMVYVSTFRKRNQT